MMSDIRPTFLLMFAVTAIVVRSAGQSVPLASTKPTSELRLEYISEEWDAYGNFLPAFRLTNDSQREITYSGYSISSPVFVQQVRGSDREEWRNQNIGWSGTGLESQRLRAGHATTFRVAPPEGVHFWRIGLKTEEPEDIVVWSKSIIANKTMVEEMPCAAKLIHVDVAKHPDRESTYTFTLKNVSEESLFYGGYQEPHVPPIYLKQEKFAEGWIDDGKADWSGTGFGFKELRPGRSILFSIPAQSLDRTWRIGIRLFRTDRPAARKDAYEPVWWEPLSPRSES